MFDTEAFQCTLDDNGNTRAWYSGIEIPQIDRLQCRGSRQYYNINDEFFIKATYGGAYVSQCKIETYQYGKIEDCDRRYFTELLATCDFKSNCHWTAWRYVKLQRFIENNRVWQRCERIVDQLCRKYGIADVYGCLNWNWFIHNDEPLIVDFGCD